MHPKQTLIPKQITFKKKQKSWSPLPPKKIWGPETCWSQENFVHKQYWLKRKHFSRIFMVEKILGLIMFRTKILWVAKTLGLRQKKICREYFVKKKISRIFVILKFCFHRLLSKSYFQEYLGQKMWWRKIGLWKILFFKTIWSMKILESKRLRSKKYKVHVKNIRLKKCLGQI